MFFPLGFGSNVKKFPFAIATICLTCIFWSSSFFETIQVAEAETESLRKSLELEKSMEILILSRCKNLGLGELCDDMYRKDEVENTQAVPEQKNSEAQSTDDFEWILKLAQLKEEFSKKPADWPEEIKSDQKFPDFLITYESFKSKALLLRAEKGFLTSKSLNLLTALRATFTHSDLFHLISNLLIILFIGAWVEQRVGFLATATLFLGGSGLGLGIQTALEPDLAVLGASAGGFTLMGLFFSMFYHKEATLLAFFPPFLVRVLSLPILWTFPFFYFATDFLAALSTEMTGVAHLAHLGGLLVGLMAGYAIRKVDHLGPDQAFAEEAELIRLIEQERQPDRLWSTFANLMSWNNQNWHGIRLYLTRLSDLQLKLESSRQKKHLTKILKFSCLHFMKRSEVKTMKEFLKLIPEEIDLMECLENTPVSQILFLADHAANTQDYDLASRIYASVLNTERLNALQAKKIERALAQIQNLNLTKEIAA